MKNLISLLLPIILLGCASAPPAPVVPPVPAAYTVTVPMNPAVYSAPAVVSGQPVAPVIITLPTAYAPPIPLVSVSAPLVYNASAGSVAPRKAMLTWDSGNPGLPGSVWCVYVRDGTNWTKLATAATNWYFFTVTNAVNWYTVTESNVWESDFASPSVSNPLPPAPIQSLKIIAQ